MAPFPPPPTNTIDWVNLGFEFREVNGHIESAYSKRTGEWTPLRFVRSPMLSLHGMSPALNYGQQAYEGMKAFRAPSGAVRVFRPDRNARRLARSADVMSIPPVPEAVFMAAVRAAVALNAEFVPPHETGAALYVRPMVFGSSPQLRLVPPEEYTFCVFVVPTGVYHGTGPVRGLVMDEFDRSAPNGTGHVKVGGNYAPVLRWSDAAREKGYGITLHLDSKAHEEVDEFSTSGFVGIKNGGDGQPVMAVPDSKCVIDSVTSDSVQQLGRSFGWRIDKRPIKYTELPEFDEVMAAGTAVALVPIRSITRRVDAAAEGRSLSSLSHERVSVSAGGEDETVTYMPAEQDKAGPLCARLLSKLQGIQLGREEDTFGWCVEVTEDDTQVTVVE